MNLGAFDIPDPPPLPAPPALSHYTLENPYPLVIGLLVLAGVFWWRGAGRPWRDRLLAGVPVAGAIFTIVLAHAVQTPRERVMELARALVAGVARGDAASVERLMLDSCVVERGRWGGVMSKREIVSVVDRDFGPRGMYRLREAGIPRVDAAIDSPTFARVQLKVRATPEATGGPLLSWWRLDLRHEHGDWRVSGIAALTSDEAGPAGR